MLLALMIASTLPGQGSARRNDPYVKWCSSAASSMRNDSASEGDGYELEESGDDRAVVV